MFGLRRLRTFGWSASAAVAVALLVPAGGAAQTRTVETATLGPVTAELSYVQRQRGSGSSRFIEYRDFRVRIQRNGLVLYDKPIGEPCERFCTPTDSELTRAHIGMAELDGDSEFEVIVDLFTGGANCCVLVHAFGYDPVANTYRRARLDTGGGFTHSDYPPRDDVTELVGDDFRFRGLFTCGACGSRPLRIWHYTLSGFEVVTRSFPDQIREHAARMKRQYERVRHRKDAPVFVKGALTPYAADLCLLDRCDAGFRLVRTAIRRGELDRRSAFDVAPHGRAYLRALKRFLRRSGYLR